MRRHSWLDVCNQQPGIAAESQAGQTAISRRNWYEGIVARMILTNCIRKDRQSIFKVRPTSQSNESATHNHTRPVREGRLEG